MSGQDKNILSFLFYQNVQRQQENSTYYCEGTKQTKTTQAKAEQEVKNLFFQRTHTALFYTLIQMC